MPMEILVAFVVLTCLVFKTQWKAILGRLQAFWQLWSMHVSTTTIGLLRWPQTPHFSLRILSIRRDCRRHRNKRLWFWLQALIATNRNGCAIPPSDSGILR